MGGGAFSKRSIPAHTGERCSSNLRIRSVWVYPRTYGGTIRSETDDIDPMGLSPHIRGNAIIIDPLVSVSGSIPAHTGER